MRVKDVMTTRVLRVGPRDRVEKAARLIADRHISGVFVTDGGKLLGKISHSDLLHRIFPTPAEFYDDIVHNGDFEQIETRTEDLIDQRVEDVMSDDVLTIPPETHVMKVAAWMLIQDVHRAAVTDEEGKLLGVVSRGDVFYHLIKREVPAHRAARR